MMIDIDGSEGEGGGQIIRSSLALAAVTGKPTRLRNLRAGRKKPGLLRQHLTGVRAIAEISGAEVVGANLGSTELTFTPSAIRGGDYSYQVGSAGSTVLVAQTILPALLAADQPSSITIGGGTHASWAPPFEFFKHCYLLLLAKIGGKVSVTLQSHGFYPAGGGEIRMQVSPAKEMQGIELTSRQGSLTPSVTALVAEVPVAVGDRECSVIRRKTGWPEDAFGVVASQCSGGPGNVVMIQCDFDNVSNLVTGFGKVGVKAEQVARSTIREANKYLNSDVPVGEYLADQLLMPMGLAANQGHESVFCTVPLSLHSQTHINVLKRFLDIEIEVTNGTNDTVTVRVSPAKA